MFESCHASMESPFPGRSTTARSHRILGPQCIGRAEGRRRRPPPRVGWRFRRRAPPGGRGRRRCGRRRWGIARRPRIQVSGDGVLLAAPRQLASGAGVLDARAVVAVHLFFSSCYSAASYCLGRAAARSPLLVGESCPSSFFRSCWLPLRVAGSNRAQIASARPANQKKGPSVSDALGTEGLGTRYTAQNER